MLTTEEAQLYDRQIRLWGVDAQTKLRSAKVLMLGFNGIASEVAKTLVLAGINSLTIIDNEPLQDSDLTSNLFCREKSHDTPYRTHAVREKLRILNPLVNVNIINEPITSAQVDKNIEVNDLVSLHSFLPTDEIIRINNKCRSHVKFYIALDFGLFGFMFNDLGSEFKFTHEVFDSNVDKENPTAVKGGDAKSGQDYIEFIDDDKEDDEDEDEDEDEVSDENSKPRKRQRVRSPIRNNQLESKHHKYESLNYYTFDKFLSLDSFSSNRQTSPLLVISIAMFKFYDKFLRTPQDSDDDMKEFDTILNPLVEKLNLQANFKRLDRNWRKNINGSLGPICAVLGGVAGQDMIRVLSQSGIPIYNTFLFDGIQLSGTVEKVGSDESKSDKIIQPVVREFVELE